MSWLWFVVDFSYKYIAYIYICIFVKLSFALISVLKDVPSIPSESYGPQQRDSVRLSVFPNLNYSGLYHAALTVIDLVPMVQLGQLGTV